MDIIRGWLDGVRNDGGMVDRSVKRALVTRSGGEMMNPWVKLNDGMPPGTDQ